MWNSLSDGSTDDDDMQKLQTTTRMIVKTDYHKTDCNITTELLSNSTDARTVIQNNE